VIAGRIVDRGWCRLESRLPSDLLGSLTSALDQAYGAQRALQIRNGVGGGADGTVHHLPCAAPVFLDALELLARLAPLDEFFGGPFILNTYGAVLNRPDEPSYVARIHRDLRTFSGELRLMVQLMVMLDEFTEENGATYFLEGSHRTAAPPAESRFFAEAVRATGPAGSIVMFDSNLWHAAGVNRTPRPRRALTLAFTRPFVKQQLDYPRALGYDRAAALSPALRQLLGYNARVPSTLDEWYQPADRRLDQRDQG
jgi:hypothetical protein